VSISHIKPTRTSVKGIGGKCTIYFQLKFMLLILQAPLVSEKTEGIGA
jgi:hypothetical protein